MEYSEVASIMFALWVEDDQIIFYISNRFTISWRTVGNNCFRLILHKYWLDTAELLDSVIFILKYLAKMTSDPQH